MANERSHAGQTGFGPSNPHSGTIEEAKADARAAGEEIKSEVSAGVHRAGAQARSFASDQKDYAASQLGGIADAVSRVAAELEKQDQASLARYARQIGNGMRDLSETARESSIDDLVHDAQSFGRRNPAAFLGAAALLGFAASRFLTASTHRHGSSTGAPATKSSGDGSPPATH